MTGLPPQPLETLDALEEYVWEQPARSAPELLAMRSGSDNARAALGVLLAEAVDDAIAEVDSCSGERDALDRLEALAPQIPAASILSALRLDPTPQVRQAAIRALTAFEVAHRTGYLYFSLAAWRLPVPDWLPAGLEDPDSAVRAEAARSATALNEPIPAALLRDPSPAVADAALHGLAEEGSAEVGAVLAERLLQGEDLDQIARLIRSSGRLDAPLHLLAERLAQHPSQALAEAMVEWVTPAAHPALRRALSADVGAATAAALALCRCPDPAAAPALQAAARSPHRRLSVSASLALAAAGEPPALLPPDTPLAGTCMALIGTADARRLLRRMETSNLYAQRTLAVAAGVCGVDGAAPILTRWMRAADRRLAARAALGLALLAPERVSFARIQAHNVRVATFELDALAVVSGLRAAGRRSLPPAIRAQCRAWAQALAPGTAEAVRCYRGHGSVSGWARPLALWIRDLRDEAEALLR